MDVALTRHLLTALLPPEAVEYIHVHFLHPHAPVQVFKRRLLMELQRALNAVYPFVQPVVDRLLLAASENQGVTGTIALVVLLAVVVVVMNWIRRLLMWWTRLAMRAVFWAAVVAVAAWVWNRGLFESVRDAVVVGGRVVGYLAVLKDFWLDEYNRYEGQQSNMGGAQGGSSRR